MIEFSNRCRSAIDQALLLRIGERILQNERRPKANVSVMVAGEKTMRTLNKRYRGKDYAANVLSFPLGLGSEEENPLGEIVLCPVRIGKDARKYGIRESEAQAWMFLHGLLHLLGREHETEGGRRLMESEEKEILSLFFP